MPDTFTDCRSDEGVTVGLLDSVITLCRVLRGRDIASDAVQEALKDLAQDEDFLDLCFALEQFQ